MRQSTKQAEVSQALQQWMHLNVRESLDMSSMEQRLQSSTTESIHGMYRSFEHANFPRRSF